MRIMQETTKWEGATPNHVYVMNDAMTRMIAYVPEGSTVVKKFSQPIPFDTRGRTFVELEGVPDAQPEPSVIEVKGSKGEKYRLSEEDGVWQCSCPGFKFRGTCKHLSMIKEQQ